MKKREFEKFDLLLISVSETLANDMADEFLAMDIDDVEITPKTDIAAQRYIRKHRHIKKHCHPIKTLLIACLIALSVAFTACMTIEEIRNAIKNVFVQWYDDHIAISFGDSPTEQNVTPNDVIPEAPPTEIEQKACATYAAGAKNGVVSHDINTFYQVNYCDENGDLVFILSQRIISEELHWNDQDNITAQAITINNHKAYLITDNQEPNLYTLVWQDYYYQYDLYGYFTSQDEIIKTAENIQLK